MYKNHKRNRICKYDRRVEQNKNWKDLKNNLLELVANIIVYITMQIPNTDTSFKTYMDYRTITDETSPQWDIQEIAYIDKQGFQRVNDDYVVAMGTYYSDVMGTRFRITLENDKEFTVILGDKKRDDETDKKNMYHPVYDENGDFFGANVIEFIVDTEMIDEDILKLGTLSSLGFEGNIVKIERIDELSESNLLPIPLNQSELLPPLQSCVIAIQTSTH